MATKGFSETFLTYKENVPDTRESPVKEMVKELKEFGVDVYGYDPLLGKEEIERFGVKALDTLDEFNVAVDCVILAVAHDEFKNKPFLMWGSAPSRALSVPPQAQEGFSCKPCRGGLPERLSKGLKKAFSERTTFFEENFFFLSTGSFFRKKVLNEKPVLIDVRGMIDENEAGREGFYYKTL